MGIHKCFVTREAKAKQIAPCLERDSWRAKYPSDADFNFNYWQLLNKAESSAIGKNNNPNLKIAIIGAGVAGLTAARELFRCGYTNIHIYEASDRLGGRTYSKPIPGRYTTYEMGAMRMPYFSEPGSKNSVIDYYTTRFKIKTQNFPNPGGNVADTGIYLHNGLGPEPAKNPLPNPQLLIWQKENSNEPPTEVDGWKSLALKNVHKKWTFFAEMFIAEVEPKYNDPNPKVWQEYWQQIVQHYWEVNFRDFVYLKNIKPEEYKGDGDFGGLGMTDKEADLFYTIGAGDGAWGAFYEISCLYVIRTLLFGFGKNHQLIQGLFDDENKFVGGNQCQQKLKDSLEKEFDGPNYLGVETFADCLFFNSVKSHNSKVNHKSLYDAMVSPDLGVKLFLQNPVNKLEKLDSEKIKLDSVNVTEEYDIVIPTLSPWAGQLSIDIEGFEKFPQQNCEQKETNEMPFLVAHSLKTMHWITSCKVFYPLKERYWEKTGIPQLLSTDTLLQGIYAYALDLDQTSEPEAGVLLVSYTWEDDANKFIASQDDQKLARELLDKLDDILRNCSNIGVPISPYVDTSVPTIIQWAKQPSYRGCAKLYRERTEDENSVLLRYNQERSQHTNIYFAGEAFSVTGGWTEPAFRGALDAVIHIIKNNGGEFLNGFDCDRDYPKHSTWTPNEKLDNCLDNLHMY